MSSHHLLAAAAVLASLLSYAACLYFKLLPSVQQYVKALEQLVDAQRKEILEHKAEQRRAAAERRKLERQSASPPPFGSSFCGMESSGLPNKLRAIVEDNRVLKEKAKKLRQRCMHWEAECGRLREGHEHAEQQSARFKQQLRECSITADEVAALKVCTQAVGVSDWRTTSSKGPRFKILKPGKSGS
jgi:hypothetical protein